MDWKSAIIGGAVTLAAAWAGRLLWSAYRLWLARLEAEAEKTETTADDEAVEDLKEAADKWRPKED